MLAPTMGAPLPAITTIVRARACRRLTCLEIMETGPAPGTTCGSCPPARRSSRTCADQATPMWACRQKESTWAGWTCWIIWPWTSILSTAMGHYKTPQKSDGARKGFSFLGTPSSFSFANMIVVNGICPTVCFGHGVVDGYLSSCLAGGNLMCVLEE